MHLYPLLPLISAAILVSGNIIDRALPSGHPTLSEADLPQANYTLDPVIWPSGFLIPTETLTGLPSGYSVGPTAVWNPQGQVVSSLPPDAISEVEVKPSSTTSESSLSSTPVTSTPITGTSVTSTASSGSTPTQSSSGVGQKARIGGAASLVVGIVAVCVLL